MIRGFRRQPAKCKAGWEMSFTKQLGFFCSNHPALGLPS